ncbi:MAG: phosphoribosylamine--glycine ligase [Actinobacteria bacterium]|nr:MAG: phosphoribosylamine--glycine ligase [Actinomycetota bacterium]
MRVLVVGGGGREHALTWKLSQNPTIDKIFAAPGNAGIEEVAHCEPLDVVQSGVVADYVEANSIDLTVVGPEAPLVAGLADELTQRGMRVFGPSKAAARIEGSKAWAKEIMTRAGVPTARSETVATYEEGVAALDRFDLPVVVKADGLAAGKGVTVADDRDGAEQALRACLIDLAFGEAGATVVIEEFLEGEELSILCITDGRAVVPLVPAQDFKRAQDGDRGPNTGGMGSYSPVPQAPPDIVDRAVREVFEPAIRTLEAEGADYVGCLYGGLMLTKDGPKVLEFNCRFGDPETQAVIPRLDSDLAELFLAATEGNLSDYKPIWTADACVVVVLASGGYPGRYKTGMPIAGLAEAAAIDGVEVFHAGTARRKGAVVTAGGRVLAVSARAENLRAARERAYQAVGRISFEGMHYRTDIAERAASNQGGR